MPKPISTAGKGNGNGGGGGPGTSFAVTGFADGVITGTIDSDHGDLTYVIRDASGTIVWSFTAAPSLTGTDWTYDTATATVPPSLDAGDYTVTASYTETHKNGRDKITTTDAYAFTIEAAPNTPATITGDLAADVDEDGTLSDSATLTVTDPDAGEDALQPVTAGTASDLGYGTIEVLANGTWIYTLDNSNAAVQALGAGDTLSDSFTVTSADGTASETVNVTITGANDAASISGTNAGSVTEDSTLQASGTLSVTDPDAGEAAMQAQTGVAGSYGTFSIDSSGNWTYDLDNTNPAVDALDTGGSLSDSFIVTSADGTASETVTVTINGANDAPVAVDDFYETAEDTPVSFNFMSNDYDPEGHFFGVLDVIGGEGEGTFVQTDILNNIWTFTPGENFNGTATIFYTLNDGFDTSEQGTITITVTPVEDPPTAVTDEATTNFETAITIDVMANDFDPDAGDTISVVSVTQGANGSVVLNPDGTVTYTPNPGFDGSDSFTYELSDPDGDTSTGTVNVTVQPEVDTTPPAVSAPDLLAASDSGYFDDDDITNDTTPTLVGTGEAGATVEVFDGASSLGTTTIDGSGNWSLTVAAPLGDGTHSLTAVATDGAGNASAPTAALDVTIDTGADTPVVTEVLNADGSPAAGGVTDDSTPTIRGTAEAGARVTVRLNGAVIATDVIADGSGLWEYTLNGAQELQDGSYTVSAEATDLAGNASAPSAGYAMEVDAIADPPPPPPPGPTGDSYTPDDPLYAQQWHLGAIGDIEAVWAEFTGAGVVVGIYDNGVEATHEDLGNYDTAYELAGFGSKEHGTAVAGVIAASDNDVGVVGVAFGATLGGANIFAGGGANINTNPAGYKAVIDQASIFDVISLSWGNGPDWVNNTAQQSIDTVNALASAAATGRAGLGTVAVKAAGNDYGNAGGDWINHSRHAIVVAAHDSGATGLSPDASWYTNRGTNVLVSAPSSGSLESGNLAIMTTDETGAAGYNTVGDYTGTGSSGFGGTSSATPVVSGVVSLMLEANPNLGWRDVQEILAYSSEKIEGDPGAFDTVLVPIIWFGFIIGYEEVPFAAEYHGWYDNGAYNWNGGGLHFNEDYGYGRVNAYNAVRMAEAWSMFWDVDAAPTDPGYVETSLNETAVSSGVQAVNAQNTVGTEFQTPLSVTFDYSGPLMSLEHVDLDITWFADQLENVTIELISPSNTVATVLLSAGDAGGVEGTKATNTGMPLGAGTIDWTFGARSFMGEDPTGTWEIRLTDEVWSSFGGLFDTLRVDEFELTFYGESVDPELSRDDTYHYTMEMLDPAYAGRTALSDAGGSDWLNLAAMSADLLVNLQDGASSYANPGLDQVEIIALDPGTVIEGAISGDGNDQLVGNDTANRLGGMRGHDTLEGGAGADDLYGHYGDDQLWGGTGPDGFWFEAGHGDDWIGDFSQAEFDFVSLSGFSDVSSFADLSFQTVGPDQVLAFSTGDSITFAGGAAWTFTENDFSINGPTLMG